MNNFNYNNAMQLAQQFNQFKQELEKSKQDPKVLLDQLLNSGRISQQQLDQARSLAELFNTIRGGK